MASRTPSRSVSRGRSRTRTPLSRTRSDSPRRSITPRSASRSRSPLRSPFHGGPPRNGLRRASSRSRSHSKTPSRNRSPPRGRRERSRSRSSGRRSPVPRSSKIVVEKLTKNVNEGHLREIFGSYGVIRDVDLPMNRQFMTNRGTAYILYRDAVDAEAAIAHMHEAQLDGAVLNVSIVLPRRKFSRSPPPARRLQAHLDRLDSRNGPPGAYRPPPPSMGGRVGRYRSPPPRRGSPPRRYPGSDRGRGYQDTYMPRSTSRSRSPMRRSRSRSYSSRSRSRSLPPPRRRGVGPVGRVESPRESGRRRRSPSYSSYSSYSRSRSRSRDRRGPGRR